MSKKLIFLFLELEIILLDLGELKNDDEQIFALMDETFFDLSLENERENGKERENEKERENQAEMLSITRMQKTRES